MRIVQREINEHTFVVYDTEMYNSRDVMRLSISSSKYTLLIYRLFIFGEMFSYEHGARPVSRSEHEVLAVS
jgi:hypothetical protein